MKIRVLRRNRRTIPSSSFPKHAILLVVSAALFIASIGDLAWAYTSQLPSGPDQTMLYGSQTRPDEKPDPYNGTITANQNADGSQTADPAQDPFEATYGPVEENILDVDPYEGAPLETSTEAPPSPSEPSSSSTVHHSAYRQYPVYRIVHHQASTITEKTIGGKTFIEKTKCPVCGQYHTSAYNERIVDHVVESYCPACGAYHADDYDETVYY